MCLALRASGLWLRYAALQNLIPSFPWIAPPRPLHPYATQGKEGIKFCHLATMAVVLNPKGFPDLRTFGSCTRSLADVAVVHLDSDLLLPRPTLSDREYPPPLSRAQANIAYCFSVIPPSVRWVLYFYRILPSVVPHLLLQTWAVTVTVTRGYQTPGLVCKSHLAAASCPALIARNPSPPSFRTSHRKSLHCSFLPSFRCRCCRNRNSGVTGYCGFAAQWQWTKVFLCLLSPSPRSSDRAILSLSSGLSCPQLSERERTWLCLVYPRIYYRAEWSCECSHILQRFVVL